MSDRKDDLVRQINDKQQQIFNLGSNPEAQRVAENERKLLQDQLEQVESTEIAEKEQATDLEEIKAKRVFTVNGEELTLDDDTAELFGILLDSEIPKINAKHNDTVAKIRETFRQQAEETTQAVAREAALIKHQYELDLGDAYTKLHNAETIAKEAEEAQRVTEEKLLIEERRVLNLESKLKQKDVEIYQLGVEIQNLKNQVTPTEITSQGNRAKELVEKIRLKNIEYVDFKRSKMAGTDAQGNVIEFGYMEQAKYESVTDFPAPSFENVEIPQEDFRNAPETDQSVEPTGEPQDIYAGGQAEGNAATQPREVSREEFDELKADVEALKRGRIAA